MPTDVSFDAPGWPDVVEWFGGPPRFHDAEVLSIDLRRWPEPSTVRVHAFRMTAETDSRGYFILDRHAVVTFELACITEFDMNEWNHQNVLDSLELEHDGDGLLLVFNPAYGIGGDIRATGLNIRIQPYEPPLKPGAEA